MFLDSLKKVIFKAEHSCHAISPIIWQSGERPVEAVSQLSWVEKKRIWVWVGGEWGAFPDMFVPLLAFLRGSIINNHLHIVQR